MGDFENREREEVFSKKVRAGKRTYFFDVKATRSNDYYVTITESKKTARGWRIHLAQNISFQSRF